MEILITGATGFIGEHLRSELVPRHLVLATTRGAAMTESPNLIWRQADLSYSAFVSALPPHVDAVVCLAQSRAYRQFPDQVEDIFNINVRATLSLLEYARKAGASTFLYASTANVYRQSSQKISEDWPVEPATFYARSKRMAEMMVESYAGFFDAVVLRLFTVYGPGQKEMLIPNLIDRVRQNRSIQVQGKYGFKISPIFVGDVTDIIIRFLERKTDLMGSHIFNVGGDEALGVYDLGLVIGETLALAPRFDYVPGEEPAGWVADSSRLKRELGLAGFLPFREGMKNVIA
jgi:UDP-glucose 4-epimerase